MSDTYQFALPLVQAAQAQKHVTVNEALSRLDAVAQMRVVTDDLISPPVNPLDGEAYVVAAGAIDAWAGKDDDITIFSNGGWVFLSALTGWRAWNETTGAEIVFDGANWVSSVSVFSLGGAASLQRIVEIDHVLDVGASSSTIAVIPSHAQVIGVSARVIDAVAGSGVSSWSLGVAGSIDRYGTGLGLGLNSVALGLGGSPMTYWSDTALEITADAGSFSTGTVRLAVHFIELASPRAV